MALVSPGVEVNVIDESFYTPASAGTVPMIFVASAENKVSASGTGIAAGTLKSNAGRPYLLTSQRELGELFGDPLFYSDNNNNMIHGSELNEYGLQTAYSALGVTNRAYVARADIDLAKLAPSAFPPGGKPANGTYWFDTQVTDFGLLEWNASPVTVEGGQSFTILNVIRITETSDVDEATSGPLDSIGGIGDYAIVATTTMNRVWFKNTNGNWVEVGSDEWQWSWPAVTGSVSNPTLTNGDTILINGETVVLSGTSVEDLANSINALSIDGISADVVDGFIEIYVNSQAASDGTNADGFLNILEGSGSLLSAVGITATVIGDSSTGGTRYSAPKLNIGPHTQVPQFKNTDVMIADSTPDNNSLDDSISPVEGFSAYPTGSLWIKTTSPNGGANFSIKRWNSETELWERIFSPIYETNADALFNLDRSGGGANLVTDDLYIKVNVDELDLPIANYKIYRRVASGATTIVSKKIVAGTLEIGSSNNEFTMAETLVNSRTFGATKTVSFTSTGSSTDAQALAAAINNANFVNIRASVNSQNRVEISHKTGGEIKIVDIDGTLTEMGFVPFDETDPTTTSNLYYSPNSNINTNPAQYTASNWKVLTYVANNDEPLDLAEDGELWYNSIIDEVDIMYHNGNDWVGYRDTTAFPDTDPAGPNVGASAPTLQSDGTPLVDNDLWIDTSDIENYPLVYRYNKTLNNWIQVDKTDQTTENGMIFRDARWSDAGSNSEPADIDDLLLSNYKDPDAPDPNLYPKGMLLWNLRRSGFNVKRFVRNYINTAQDNVRFPVETSNGNDFYSLQGDDQSMENYYPHRWVTDSGNNVDGSGTFGRHAQRKSVVQALQAMVNSNQEIRDEETRFFNLVACPGYPELIGEMITLNYDRKLTTFVVGDTPARLTPDATSLNEWATNVRLAVEDNDQGAVSFDEYLGMYYLWGYTSDNAGNNVVVPPSHMALRTIILNDQIAFPWFAPAGTRRGGVTNATSSGYINSEGEFVPIALNSGQRNVLYSNSINPITFIAGSGLLVYGQKTRARNASALDRINVARLVVYMRVQLERLVKPYLFEPNDKITRDQVKAAADAFLLELVSLRGLYDFLTVCDESNNTPARIDRNELYLDIAIEPVKAIEFIYIPLRLKNTGEIASLG